MPELPDVELYRHYIDSTALHQKISQVKTEPSVLTGLSAKQFGIALEDKVLESTRRHGKYLFIKLNNHAWIVFHFGMTGFVRYYQDDSKAPEHVRCTLEFENGYKLVYDSQRKLGRIGLIKDLEQFIKRQNLGIDALSRALDLERFTDLLQSRRGAVKTFLMNQSVIAGIGNIYSDEILFQSGIHPKKNVKKLSANRIDTLFNNTKRVLNTAIEVEADPKRMPSNYLLPHRDPGEQCPHCKGKIKRITVNGRGTYFCSKHQKG